MTIHESVYQLIHCMECPRFDHTTHSCNINEQDDDGVYYVLDYIGGQYFYSDRVVIRPICNSAKNALRENESIRIATLYIRRGLNDEIRR